MTKENEFSRAELWPKAPFIPRFANGVTAETRRAQFGIEPNLGIRDAGLLKVENGVWKMFEPSGESGEWLDFEKDNIGHRSHANFMARYGPGWSEGPFLQTGHGSQLAEVQLRLRAQGFTEMDIQDVAYSPALAAQHGITQVTATDNLPPVPTDDERRRNKPPVVTPPPPAQGRSIRYTFGTIGKREDIEIPPGTTKVLFKGTVTVPPITGDAIRPWIGVRVGEKDGDRENAGMVGIGGREQIRVEAGGVRSKEFQKGFARVAFIAPVALEFEWTPGEVRVVYGKQTRIYNTGVTEGAERGGRITLGVNPGGEYSLLPAGALLEGTLTMTGGNAQPGPVDPPIDPLPPVPNVELAKEHLRQALALLG